MLYRKMIAVCSEIHTKHLNMLCEQNVKLWLKPDSTYNNHWALMSWNNPSCRVQTVRLAEPYSRNLVWDKLTERLMWKKALTKAFHFHHDNKYDTNFIQAACCLAV
jgi:hypothetical protein